MRYVSAYLLAVLGGNENPGEADIKKILSSVGIDADAEALKKVIASLKGKNLEQLIAEGERRYGCDARRGRFVFLFYSERFANVVMAIWARRGSCVFLFNSARFAPTWSIGHGDCRWVTGRMPGVDLQQRFVCVNHWTTHDWPSLK